MWYLWWTKWQWGRFSRSTSVSPANSHSTDYSTIIIIICGWYNRPNSGHSTKWTQSHPMRKKKYILHIQIDTFLLVGLLVKISKICAFHYFDYLCISWWERVIWPLHDFAYFYQINDPFWNILIKNQISAWGGRRQGIAFAGWWSPLSETRGRLCCNVQIVWRRGTQFNTHIHRLAAGNTVSAPPLASYLIHNSARTACLEFRTARGLSHKKGVCFSSETFPLRFWVRLNVQCSN
jgi:hypothetical protein